MFKASKGDRPDARNIILLLTPNKSTRPDLTNTQATLTKFNDIFIYGIVIKSTQALDEAQQNITSQQDAAHFVQDLMDC